MRKDISEVTMGVKVTEDEKSPQVCLSFVGTGVPIRS